MSRSKKGAKGPGFDYWGKRGPEDKDTVKGVERTKTRTELADEKKKTKPTNQGAQAMIQTEENENEEPLGGSKWFYHRQWKINLAQVEKLKQLLLLTDPAVSNVEMNDLTIKQWAEFVRWNKDKYGVEP